MWQRGHVEGLLAPTCLSAFLRISRRKASTQRHHDHHDHHGIMMSLQHLAAQVDKLQF